MGYKLTWAYIGTDKVRPSWPELITTAWIYHSSDLWLISLSTDWSTWITIADKNLGATTVYHNGDGMSESNCWWLYQRWNNYKFPLSWSITTSSTRVNPTWYWPGTVNWYRSNSTYIAGDNWWMSTYVADLWGATTDTNEAKQWPCDTWYHIATFTEWESLISAGVTISAWTSSDATYMKNYLFMPYSNKRSQYGSVSTTDLWLYRTANGSTTKNAFALIISSSIISARDSERNCSWFCIRPFYNTSVQPDISWTLIYQPS